MHLHHSALRGWTRWATAILLALAVTYAGAARSVASPPVDPIPVPLYSLDLASPTLEGAPPELRASAVLAKVQGADLPKPVIFGERIGMPLPGDELDAFSFNPLDVPFGRRFLLLYSVDRATTGDVPPDEELLAAGIPFNVADQAARGHAAGDGFVSLSLFDRNGIVSRMRAPGTSGTQAINNYDEGGSDFQAQPPTSSRDYSTDEQDDVDAMGQQATASRGAGFDPIYFSAGSQSPSLGETLPGTSGADLFYDPFPMGTIPVRRFASASMLGLVPGDDIDGLVMFDENSDGGFGPGDQVIFSLRPGSPSLRPPFSIPDISSNGAADVLTVRINALGQPEIRIFARAADLGLVGPNDNVDALGMFLCSGDPVDCARAVGIRLIRGDWDNDGDVDICDYPSLAQCISGPKESPAFVLPSPPCREVFDFDVDTDIDLGDFTEFQIAFEVGDCATAP